MLLNSGSELRPAMISSVIRIVEPQWGQKCTSQGGTKKALLEYSTKGKQQKNMEDLPMRKPTSAETSGKQHLIKVGEKSEVGITVILTGSKPRQGWHP